VNKDEANALLEQHLLLYRCRAYSELAALLGHPEVTQHVVASGAKYQIEVEAFWDDRPGGNIRVLGAIDDGGWRGFKPLCAAFIMAPSGAFVGE
jgi:hypothetical protein